MKKLIVAIMFLSLVGCAGTQVTTKNPYTEEENQPALENISISDTLFDLGIILGTGLIRWPCLPDSQSGSVPWICTARRTDWTAIKTYSNSYVPQW